LTTFLNHRLRYPYETEEYYQKLIREGHTELVVPDLPKLNNRNRLAVEVWNLISSFPSMTIMEAADILGIEVTKADLYSIGWKVVHINRLTEKFKQEEIEKERQRIESASMAAQTRARMR